MQPIPVWVPAAGSSLKAELPATEDFEFVDMPEHHQKIVVVASNAAQLSAARATRQKGIQVILWGWRLSEEHALSAEDSFPVIYEPPTREIVDEKWGRAAERTIQTEMFWKLERALNFPEVLPAA